MALDRLLDFFAHRFLRFFFSVLVFPHVQQTKLASSLCQLLMHLNILTG